MKLGPQISVKISLKCGPIFLSQFILNMKPDLMHLLIPVKAELIVD
jgi:hypothetical protein